MSDSPFIRRMDHLVVTVSDLNASLHFYQSVLGLKLLNVNGDHTVATLRAGDQLLRLQTVDRPSPLMARTPTPGSADLCFESPLTSVAILAKMENCHAVIVAGPVPKHGSRGVMTSVYTRDPDGSLIEVCSYH